MIFKAHNYQQYSIYRIVNMPVPGPGIGLFLDMG